MKSRLLLISTLLLLSIVSGRAQGTVIELDGLTYKIQNGEAALVWGPLCYDVETEEFIDPVPKVVIPEKVIGYNVTTINFNPYCDTLVIPKTVRIIDVKTTYNGMDNPNYGGWDVDDAFGAKYVDCKIENPGSKFNIYDLFLAEVKSDTWKNGSAHSWLKVPKGFESNYPNYGAGSHPIMIYSEEMVDQGVIYRVNWSDNTAIIAGYTSDFETGAGVIYAIPPVFYSDSGDMFTVVGVDVIPNVERLILPKDPNGNSNIEFLRDWDDMRRTGASALKDLIIPEGLQYLYTFLENERLRRFVFTSNLNFGKDAEINADEIYYYGTYADYSSTMWGEDYHPVNANVIYVPSTEVTQFQEAYQENHDVEIRPLPSDYATIDSWVGSLTYEYYSYQNPESGDNETRVMVTSYSGTLPDNVFIPEYYNGCIVNKIEVNAFRDNTTIKSLTLPWGVIEIGESAFQGCTNLEQVNVKTYERISIGNSAFEGCTALKKIASPYNAPTKVYSRAFQGTKALTSFELFVDGYIGSEAFSYSGIKHISQFQPFELKIEAKAFKGSKIETVYLDAGILTIGESAFEDCYKLTSVTLDGVGDGVEPNIQIGNKAFRNCTLLGNFVTHKNLRSIGNQAFDNCSDLKRIDLNPTPEVTYPTALGNTIFVSCAQLEAITFPQQVSVPDNGMIVSHIVSDFPLSSLSLVKLPMSWSGVALFGGVPQTAMLISPATDPSQINTLSFEYNTFKNATLIVPEGTLATYQAAEGWKEFVNMYENGDITPKVYVNDVEYSLSMDDKTAQVTGFQEQLLYTLVHIDLVDEIYIDENTTIPIYNQWEEPIYNTHNSLTLETTISWAGDTYQVSSIADEAFKNSHILKKLIIPENYTNLGRNTFTGSTLDEVFIYANISEHNLSPCIYSNNDGPFYGCDSLKKATVGVGACTALPYYLFCGATGLEEVNLTEGLQEIHTGAFMNTTSLKKVNLPEGLLSIESEAFKNCESLEKIIFPSSLQWIADYAFYGTKLKYICLPEDLEAVSNGAFGGNVGTSNGYFQNLDYVMCLAPIPPTRQGQFLVKDPQNANLVVPPLYVPEPYVNDYIEAWGDEFTDIRPFPNSEYIVYSDDMSSARNTTVKMPVKLVNVGEVGFFMFDVTLPEDMWIPQDSEGKYIIENSDRLSNFLVSAGRKSANEYQFYVMPTSNEAILGCAGDIFTFDICIPAFTQPGNYSIDIQNVIFTDMQGNQIESEKPLCKQSDLIITDATMGDVNDDQYIDVYDVVAMVSYIMNSRSPHFNTLSADVTNDFVIDVIDLVKVVRMVMDGVLAGSNTSFFEQPTGSFSLRPANDDTIAIDIAGDDSYVASQFVVTLDEGQQLVNVTSDEQHTVTFEPLANNQYVVVCYSNTNQAFTTNKGIVSLHVTGSGSVDVENILLVNTAYEKVALQNGLPESADSINMLTLDPSCPSDIYSTTGVMVRKNATTTQGLKPGVYIVNGVKVFIK